MICLNMIVKNESRILERCLASVAPWISHYVIGDTGSTDHTPEMIRSFFEARGIPGEVHQFPFENFAQARNRALDLAKASKGDFEYLLFTDADMELSTSEPQSGEKRGDSLRADWRAHLADPAYLVRQVSGSLTYDNTRLLARSAAARYVGATHEYIDTPGHPSGRMKRVEGIHFIDHCEGSSRSEKFDRDIRLLTESISENPNDGRAMFYLAQTYKDVGRHAEAIEWYEKRVKAGGWDEETWYSQYMIAHCYAKMGRESEMLLSAMKAYQLRPTRSEPLRLVANHYRIVGQHDLAMLFARQGKRIAMPDDLLFLEHDAYSHAFDEEISICGFYTHAEGDREDAYRSCMDMATDREAPGYMRATAISNTVHYTKSFDALFAGRSWKLEIEPFDTRLHAMNPSVCSVSLPDHPSAIRCNVRWVNYQIAPNGRYICTDGDNVIRTENEIVTLNPSTFEILERKRVVDRTPESQKFPFVVRGYEDLRLLRFRDGWWASTTVRDHSESGIAEIALLRLVEETDIFVITDVWIQPPVHPERHQKNWIPLVSKDDASFVYTSDPTVVVSARVEGGVRPEEAPVVLYENVPTLHLEHLRGSTQAIPFELAGEAGHLYVAHEAFEHVGRRYTHRFVWMNDKRIIKAVTDPFYFVRPGIEFCAGLTRTEKGSLLLSFGKADAEPWLAEVDPTAVIAQLRPSHPRSIAEG